MKRMETEKMSGAVTRLFLLFKYVQFYIETNTVIICFIDKKGMAFSAV